ncbi:MAG: LysR family transcriptional regulator [Cystobacterineae bacterium]|nr:LysR family transcriptional regulator [Cystobacterineae bacterium]
MQLESLKMFCDVVETGSFSRAAQLNHVTQSAVSQQIRALETRYEQRLLSRSARQVTPTPAGERLFRGCKEILIRFSEVEQEIQEQASEASGTTIVSSIYSVGLHELQNIQRHLLQTHPKVNLRLNYQRNDQVYDDILSGAADLGLVAYPQSRAGIDIVEFRKDDLVLICPPQHPLASLAKVHLSQLVGLPFLAFERETPTRKGVDKILRDYQLSLMPTMEMDNIEAIKRGVELGLGIAIVPIASVRHELALKTLMAKHFVEGTFTRTIGILLRKGKFLARSTQAVLDTFQAVATQENSRPPLSG